MTNNDDIKVVIKNDAPKGNSQQILTTSQDLQVVNLYDQPVTRKRFSPAAAPVETVEEVVVETPEVENKVESEVKEESEGEVSRRDALKRISDRERKVSEQAKEVKDKLAKAEEFQKFFEAAKEDPTLIAKAFGMETGDFLRKMQNKVFDIKEEPKKEDPVQTRFNALEQQTQQLLKAQADANRYGVISQHIMPVLTKDPEKFQVIHEDLNNNTNYIYDLINSHWLETGGEKGGEILDANAVAEALEEKLTEKKLKDLENMKKLPKFRSQFVSQEDKKENKESKEVTSPAKSVSAKAAPARPHQTADGAAIVYQDTLDSKDRKHEESKRYLRENFPHLFGKNKR